MQGQVALEGQHHRQAVLGNLRGLHVRRQPRHADVIGQSRIAKESPFGAPIAHGYFTLSLVAGRFFDLLDLQGMGMVINYGTNKVRFPNPLKEDARFRLAIQLGDVTDKKGGWVEAIFHAAIEIDGEAKPACAAECVFRFLPAS